MRGDDGRLRELEQLRSNFFQIHITGCSFEFVVFQKRANDIGGPLSADGLLFLSGACGRLPLHSRRAAARSDGRGLSLHGEACRAVGGTLEGVARIPHGGCVHGGSPALLDDVRQFMRQQTMAGIGIQRRCGLA